jgi:plasmid maintenance system antidote protein VapI
MSIQGYAELYGVHRATISGIVNGRTWRDDAKRELRKDQATIQA